MHVEDRLLTSGYLTVQNTYIELHKGSKVVTVVVRNSTAYLQTAEKEDPSGKSCHDSYSDTGTHCTEWISMKVLEENLGHPGAQVNHETMAREAV